MLNCKCIDIVILVYPGIQINKYENSVFQGECPGDGNNKGEGGGECSLAVRVDRHVLRDGLLFILVWHSLHVINNFLAIHLVVG